MLLGSLIAAHQAQRRREHPLPKAWRVIADALCWLGVLCCLGALAGCATAPALPASVNVPDVTLFPQTELQCGPAALASVLARAGLPHSVDTLSGWMVTPGLGGSLQADLLGAARRAGALPVRITPTLAALAAQLALERPVLALQNLGLRSWPQWHYVVVIAIDRERGVVTVGGTNGAAEEVSARAFLRAWNYAEGWAIVVLVPGDAPSALDLVDYVDAAVALESIGMLAAAESAYVAGLERWPDSDDLRFGLGNAAAAQGALERAASAYQVVLRRHAQHVAALNNLADVRRRQDRLIDASRIAREALEHAHAGAERAAVLDTLHDIATCGSRC